MTKDTGAPAASLYVLVIGPLFKPPTLQRKSFEVISVTLSVLSVSIQWRRGSNGSAYGTIAVCLSSHILIRLGLHTIDDDRGELV